MNTKSNPFVIVRAQAEDAAALLEYLKIVGGETDNLSFGAEGVPLGPEAEQAYLRAQSESADNVQYLAKADGEIIGTASLNRKPRRMSHRGEFGISLKKAWWGSGAASALTEAVLAFAKENGFEQLNLEVRSDNVRAVGLYEKFGFRKLCTFPAFFKIDGQDVDFYLMNLDMGVLPDRKVPVRPTVRLATRDELPRVNELRKTVSELHASGRPDVFRPGFCEELQQRLYTLFDDPTYEVIVACLGEVIGGFAVVQYVDRPESAYRRAGHFCHIEEFGVDEAYRRRGVGTALLAFCKSEAKRRGFERLELDVWSFNETAQKFYESAGFHPCRSYLEAEV